MTFFIFPGIGIDFLFELISKFKKYIITYYWVKWQDTTKSLTILQVLQPLMISEIVDTTQSGQEKNLGWRKEIQFHFTTKTMFKDNDGDVNRPQK